MGKTTCLLNLCRQMIAADIRPIVFSYHQDIDEKLDQSVDSIRFVDFDGLNFNPLQVLDRNSRMAHLDVAGAMRDIFAAIYPELGDIQTDRIRRAIKDSFDEIGWSDLGTASSDAQEPPFRRFVEILRPIRSRIADCATCSRAWTSSTTTVSSIRASLGAACGERATDRHPNSYDPERQPPAGFCVAGVLWTLQGHVPSRHPGSDHTCLDFRRSTSRRRTETHSHHGEGVPQVRDFSGTRFSGSAGFQRLPVSAIANYLVLRLTEADAKSLVRNVASSQHERTLIDKLKQMARFKALYFCEGKSKPYTVNLTS